MFLKPKLAEKARFFALNPLFHAVFFIETHGMVSVSIPLSE
jgi:hypothetical protein